MPSLQMFVQSGGIALVSGEIFSGTQLDLRPERTLGPGGVQLKLAAGAPGIIYAVLPTLSGATSGLAPTFLSGGSLTSGGLTDGMELSPGDAYFVPRYRMVSGLDTLRLHAAAGSSGGRVFWEVL